MDLVSFSVFLILKLLQYALQMKSTTNFYSSGSKSALLQIEFLTTHLFIFPLQEYLFKVLYSISNSNGNFHVLFIDIAI